jgi:hypothetical protein
MKIQVAHFDRHRLSAGQIETFEVESGTTLSDFMKQYFEGDLFPEETTTETPGAIFIDGEEEGWIFQYEYLFHHVVAS